MSKLIRDRCAVLQALDTTDWKIEHRDDGCSFIGLPYREPDGSLRHFWVLGPMDFYVAEWLFEAIKTKQQNVLLNPVDYMKELSRYEAAKSKSQIAKRLAQVGRVRRGS